ncbi:VCBS domain-containing protein [Halopseudomonas maritima]|uniref:VCBS domain-containing protein n=1 Tax=Halopseudomonas maritima TaxID=2918528 RepID=UPI001EEA4748|nr:VCBS domain-containing protein [Halopseudomonas maritima]UJJ32716.1 VCBS domain-containing protein [Halopseudomonas maritima]
MSKPPHSAFKALKPQSQALALEQRILFDGAAVAAADQFDDGAAQQQNADQPEDHGQIQPEAIAAPATGSTPRHLLVIDSRVEDYEQLTAQLPSGVQALIVNADQDGISQITDMLQQLQDVDSIQILSHGSAGQFTLGSTTLSSANIADFADTLSSWAGQLSEQADILLYGCRIGASDSGRTLVAELAHWTGADVAASDDDTGALAAGGDWELETRAGDIDQPSALDALALAGYEGLLADAEPTSSLDSSGANVLLGDQFSFTVNVSNPASQEGYAPFVDLFLPVTGKDGDDGVSFVSANYLGQTLVSHSVTFDADGLATHPLALDSNGEPLVLNAVDFGLQAGDQLVVLEVPFASIGAGQPLIAIEVTATLSDLADTSFSNSSPELVIQARAGFQYGNDSLNNPTLDPSLLEAATQSFVVLPTVITFEQTISAPEGETASGPNYGRSLTITTHPAPGQTLTDVTITQPLPDSIQVTAIVPGAGGELTSITLTDGTVLTAPTAIADAIASDSLFIREFTVAYASLSGTVDTRVDFYVPETDAAGQPVINAQTGDDVTITLGAPSGSGHWVPVDPRDLDQEQGQTQIDFSGTGLETSFVAKSITLNKNVSLYTDIGSAGLTPGDTLNYSLDLAISDYFAFGRTFFAAGEFTVSDQMSDGQTLVGTPTLSFTRGGVTETVELVYSSVVNSDGSTSMVFDIGQSISNAYAAISWLNGDLAFDDQREGATTAVISYLAQVGQSYTPPAGTPHGEINEGDSFGNSATVTATLLQDRLNLTGYDESDSSSTSSSIPTGNVSIDLIEVNGGAAPANAELSPGDEVTFRLGYDLLSGDYENFSLTAYLPLPLFDISGISWSQGEGNGQWQFGDGNSNPGAVLSVTTVAGNAIVFDLGSYVNAGVDGSRIELEFTLTVGDQPFADNRSFDVLAQSSQVTTLDGKTLFSSADTSIISSVAEPLLNIYHGVVSSSSGTITGGAGSWNAPGTGGVPFTGSITDPAAVDGDLSGVDAGDLLRMATAIENLGGGGAFDVVTTVTLPAGLNFVGGSLGAANLQVTRGDGSTLVAGQDYQIDGNQITFLDANFAASLLGGREGSANDASGANLVIITYDAEVASDIAASASLQSSAALTNYASAEGGQDFTGADLQDSAEQQVAAPQISQFFADGSLDDSDSSAAHTTGSNLVIGESMLYDIVVTLPEGTTSSLVVDDLIPAGMRLNTDFNGGQGYQLITTSAGSGALGADFGGVVTVGSLTGSGGTLGDDGVDARFSFSAASVNSDNDAANNAFVIRVQLIASNVIANQANQLLQNSAQLRYQDPDGDTPNSAQALERSVGLSGGKPTITLREPTLEVVQQTFYSNTRGVDQGDSVEYIITLRNSGGNSNFDAFDITFLDSLPTQLSGLVLESISYQRATNNGGADFELVGNQLRSVAGANIDISNGGSIEIRVSGTVNDSAASLARFDNIATVQWSSLDDAGNAASSDGERTGADGNLGSGVLNDYRSSSTISVPVLQAVQISRVGGLEDTPAASPSNADNETVTVGEIIRYRVSGLLAEGSTSDYNLQITLDQGLGFLNDGTARVVFISDNGISTDVTDLITAGVLNVVGNEGSDEAQPIPSDLSGNAPGGVLNGERISVSTDGSGRTVINFNLGTLVNSDSDSDYEGVTIEFNVQVQNSAANVAGTALIAAAVDRSGSNALSGEKSVSETLVEPSFDGLTKQIIDFDANPAGTSGAATVSLSFSQNGGSRAYEVNLSDSLPTASSYQLLSVEIDGVSYSADALPPGMVVSTGGALNVVFAQLDPGTSVTILYQVELPNQDAVASTDATLTWSSLPESFSDFAGSTVGADGAVDGERTGSGEGANTYVLREGAGLGIINGTLWDDTYSADSSTTPDGQGLAGQTVTLTWAGLDGKLDTSDDNLTFSTATDANGRYQFGILPAGIYRLDTPAGTISYPQPLGDLRVRIDTDGGALGQIQVTLGEGSTASANAGYVQQNDAPVNNLPGTQNGLEDVPLALEALSISDVDVGSGVLQVTLSVLHGTLSIDPDAPLSGVVQVTGSDTAVLMMNGTLDSLNSALAALRYQGNLNYNGSDTLTVVTSDQGRTGDADGDGIPSERSDDALKDQDSLQILLAAVNDAPLANNDSAEAVEAGGTRNGIDGVNPRGNLLSNDTDVDIATNDDQLHLNSVGAGGNTVLVPTEGSVTLAGQYGDLVVDSQGNYQYLVRNDDPVVQALLASQSLSESFSYEMADLEGATSSAVLSVTLRGANDTPVGENDQAVAVEAGGLANGSGGSDATGNVLDNDTDVDSSANGETRQVTGIRPQGELVPGALTTVADGTDSTNGTVIAGSYGTLTIGADGSYRYVIDNSNPAVERLIAGDTLTETFSYQLTDAGGLNDLATLRIEIQGSNDNPLASDDVATAQATGSGGGEESNPSGNVITLPSRPGASGDPGGNGIDQDVDRSDQPNSRLTLTGIVNASEADVSLDNSLLVAVAGGTDALTGTLIAGQYGSLRIGADGAYYYDVDSEHPDVVALGVGETLSDTFTYQITDSAGLTDLAQLVVTVRGANDVPSAGVVAVLATEAGGVDNTSPGLDPSGTVLNRTTDPDGEPLTVTGISTSSGTVGVVGSALAGRYGNLTLNADGTFSYAVDNDNAEVQALRGQSDRLFERFTYQISDASGSSDSAEIIVVIRGQNDAPVASDDTLIAVEAGGNANAQPGINPSGNVLSNDSDVDGGEVPGDAYDYGETRAVSSVRTGGEDETGSDGTLGTELRGTYGWLTLNADGSYSYRLDNSMAEVQALRSSTDTLGERFSYTLVDADGSEDRASINIVVQGRNDAPVAQNDRAVAVEAGGVDNGSPGTNPTGNLLANDVDVDGYGESLSVSQFAQGNRSATAGGTLAGRYGTLTVNADGTYRYVVDNDNAAVQALRTNADSLTEVFSYNIHDLAGATSAAQLTITLVGANDAPVAVDDRDTVVEAGGLDNATAGSNPTGNLLANDNDVDANDNLTLNGLRLGSEGAGGNFTAVGSGLTLAGLYGTLTVGADGSYSYQLDNDNPVVQALKPGDTPLQEVFSYQVRDLQGRTDVAQLTLSVQGAWDAPKAVDDANRAVADNGEGTGANPVGRVLGNDSDIDDGDSLTVTGVRVGGEATGGALESVNAGTDGTNGTLLTGEYGQLVIGSDGSYQYILDNDNPVVRALGPRDVLQDQFTYAATDRGGLSDEAQLSIIIRGRNDSPIATDNSATAVEAGGVANGDSGLDPQGNVLTNDRDPEGDALRVVAVRTGAEGQAGTSGTPGTALAGLYGSLTLQENGRWVYELDNDNSLVQALRESGQTLSESFTYTVADIWGATDTAQLDVTIDGRNDAPVAADDSATAVEAGGVANGSAGSSATGNVLTNDTDVDSVANGETQRVSTVRTGAESESGTEGTVGSVLVGQYGSLTLNADGSYTYVIDNSNPNVQALRESGQTLSETFTYELEDAAGLTDSATLTITIEGANDAPVAADDSATAVEAGGTTNGTPGSNASGNVLANDSDVDSDANAESKTVSAIRTGAENASGSAGSVGTALIGTYGSLTLNADGSYTYVIDNSNAAVQALRQAGDTLSESFTYQLSDAAGLSDLATLTITIAGANDAPVAVDDTATAVEAGGTANGTLGSDATGNVLTNDTDVDSYGETRSVSAVRTGNEAGTGTAGTVGNALIGTYGSLTLNADGTYTYVIDNDNAAVQALRLSGDTLSESFTYEVVDAAGLTDSATLTVTLTGANDAPVASNNFGYAAADDGSGNAVNPTGNLLTNDRDVDAGDSLSVSGARTGAEAAGGVLTDLTAGSITLTGEHGELVINADGSYSYTLNTSDAAVIGLNPGQLLQDRFTYRASDAEGLSDQAQLTIVIRGRNDAPQAVDDTAIAVEAGGVANATAGVDPTGNVLLNDSDLDGDVLSVSAIGNGTTAGTLGSELRGQYGWLTLNSDGSYSYRVDNAMAEVQALRQSGQTLTDDFTYTLADIWGGQDSAMLRITIEGANDAPLAADDSATAVEAGGIANGTAGSNATGNVLSNDSDVDSSANGESRSVTSVRTGAESETGSTGMLGSVLVGQYGSLTLNADGSYSYEVDNSNAAVQALRTSGQTLSESFSYEVSDEAGLSDRATLTIRVRGANDAPVAVDDSATAVEAGGTANGQAGSNASGNVLSNDTDVDSSANGESKTVSAVRTGSESGTGSAGVVGGVLVGQYGSLTLNADGTYSYVIDNDNAAVQALRQSGQSLSESFTYQLRDASGASDLATLTITIDGANDAPVAVDDSAIAVEAGGSANGTAGSNATGNVLANDTDVDSSANGESHTVTTIRTGSEGDSGTSGAVGSVLVGQYGSLTLNADGSYTYVIDNDNAAVQALRLSGDTLSDSFTYGVTDAAGLSDSATLTVTIEGANDAPVANNNLGYAVADNGSGNAVNPSGNLLTNDSDVDAGDSLSISAGRTGNEAAGGALIALSGGSLTLTGQYGELLINADGSYSYTLDTANPEVIDLGALDLLQDQFTYAASDLDGLRDEAQLTIIIRGRNDAPVGSDDSASAVEAGGVANADSGSNASGNVLDNDTDEDSNPLAVTEVRSGSEAASGAAGALGSALRGQYGWLTLNADGSYVYRIDNDMAEVQALRQSGQTLTDDFTYTLADVWGATDSAQLTITLDGANDAPVAVDDTATAVEAGGTANGTAGSNATGNVLGNDTDVDSSANGETQRVSSIRTGNEAGSGTSGTVGSALIGTYGSLTLNADGSYTYVVDNDNPDVQALRLSGDTLSDSFSYSVTDAAGLTDSATLTITIAGASDAPVASDDSATAQEAGGTANGSAGADATGNVLANDSDIDGNGETASVLSVRTGNEAGSGVAGSVGSALAGQYGSLTLNADGTYTYVVDDSNPLVQALRTPGQTLSESFSYEVADAAGLTDRATLTITITGSNDAPVAVDDGATASEAGGIANGTPGSNASGNVLSNDTDVDSSANGESKTVSAIRTGAEASTGISGALGSALSGQYGSLTLNADGTYRYVIDNDNAAVQALRLSGDTLTDFFTYQVVDAAGLSDSATLTITLTGANDTPVASDDAGIALEAGGVNNGAAGINPQGNVLDNDSDVDGGELLSVIGIRTGSEGSSGSAGVLGAELRGLYGWLTINADGTTSYRLDNDMAAVQALRSSTDTLSEAFTYTVSDLAGLQDTATLNITIRGANDAPVAANNLAYSTPDNGNGNAINPAGNVLGNDSDVDAGDSLSVSAARTGNEAAGGALQGLSAGSITLTGAHGTLVLNADGSYQYTLDVNDTAVINLGPAEVLLDQFTYAASDLAGLNDQAQLSIVIRGRNDAPQGADDSATAVEAGGSGNAQAGFDPAGNVLANDRDLEGDALTVTAIRAGTEVGSGTAGTLGSELRGQYGWLTINADGSTRYRLDNEMAEVQALRQTGQTLVDSFTYTLADIWGATDQAQINITIDGRNDAPVAVDDSATAVEAGGTANASAGVDPTGNVLDNDLDVDSAANGEVLSVTGFSNQQGQNGLPGQTLQGRYGTLTLNADGSYQYLLNNDDPQVNALRNAGQTLRESFDYSLRDAAGLSSSATLNILIQGSNDNPVAQNDSNSATDQDAAPQSSGNVLDNDSDVDDGDSLQVVGVRAGEESGSGASGVVGQPLYGRYGTLVINADGSYTYSIDMSNPEVLQTAGQGPLLNDVFTYTTGDLAGGTDQAELVITLDISAPYVEPPGPHQDDGDDPSGSVDVPLGVDPAVFISPVLERNNQLDRLTFGRVPGGDQRLGMQGFNQSASIGAGLGEIQGQFVHQAVRDSQLDRELDIAWLFGRQGRISLSADGLLDDPGLYSDNREPLASLQPDTDEPIRTASSFRAQMLAAAQRLHSSPPTSQSGG